MTPLTIEFKTEGPSRVVQLQKAVNYNTILTARQVLGLTEKNCPIDVFKKYNDIELSKETHIIDPSEHLIRSIKKFETESVISVICPTNYLNKYHNDKFHIYYQEPRNGWQLIKEFVFPKLRQIDYILIRFTLDDDRIMQDWINAGCPTRWGFCE